ncbi:hypothetical protein [Aequorivita sp. Q41]|uniref:hypothetical protein n=1 Tax=Aequorivita sp. Q41 TaxID=3153300 RepID=UPI003242F235
MKINFLLIISILLSSFTLVTNAQVGIGNPDPAAALDISSTNNGLLIPRVGLSNTTSAAPLTETPTVSEMIYNTATIADVSPGYYYWDGAKWVKLTVGQNWSTKGNAGTTAGTDFLGTTDAQDFRIKTNNANRWNISSSNGQLQSYALGTARSPAYSFQTDTNTGVYSTAADAVGITTSGTEKMNISNSGVSIGSGAAAAKLDVKGVGNTVRVENLNRINSPTVKEIGTLEAVFVNDTGDLVLGGSTAKLPVSLYGTAAVNSSPIRVGHNDGDETHGLISAAPYTITVERQSIIDISYTVGAKITLNNGNVIIDGSTRKFGAYIQINQATPNADPKYAHSSESYMSKPDPSGIFFPTYNTVTGHFVLNGSVSGTLAPGVYDIHLFGYIFANEHSTRATFAGSEYDSFNVVIRN